MSTTIRPAPAIPRHLAVGHRVARRLAARLLADEAFSLALAARCAGLRVVSVHTHTGAAVCATASPAKGAKQ